MRITKKLSITLQYLYFLRFSLLFALAPIALCLADWFGVSTSLSRGILALSGFRDGMFAAAFLTNFYLTCFVTARTIAVNGQERFATSNPPRLLRRWLGTCCGVAAKRGTRRFQQSVRRALIALITPTVPTLLIFVYLLWVAFVHFRMEFSLSTLGIIVGWFLCMLCWWALSLFYYWLYDGTLDEDHPKPLVFPLRWCREMIRLPELRLPAVKAALFRFFRLSPEGFIGKPGTSQAGQIYELHFFAALALAGFFFLYLALYTVLAPVHLPEAGWMVLLCPMLPSLYLLRVFWRGDVHIDGQGGRISRLGAGFKAAVVILFAVITVLAACQWFSPWNGHALFRYTSIFLPRAFPVFATLLVLLTFLMWLFGGAAFFLDRFRVPVLTAVGLWVVLLSLIPWKTEHYFQSWTLGENAPRPVLLKPQELAASLPDDDEPLVVVTATGGGIQAAAWTARILGALEDGAQPKGTFHQRILLMSTVSGGSVGAMSFLERYRHRDFYSPEFSQRITSISGCSSLAAVAWGLEYRDFAHLFLPVFTSERDRSQALERAFRRNMTDPSCLPGKSGNQMPWRDALQRGDKSEWDDKSPITLSGSMPHLTWSQKHFPAFAMNTTVVETGDRFLLSNYAVEKDPTSLHSVVPAASFLNVYSEGAIQSDIALPTATRLSATFPAVSSASRIQKGLLPSLEQRSPFHFVDGGYFDNDGTATAIEFLDAAVAGAKSGLNTRKRKILLIEIRFGQNLNEITSPDGLEAQAKESNKSRGFLGQIAAPPEALWNAGHVGVTLRNRRELYLLARTLAPAADIYHFIIPFEQAATIEPRLLSLRESTPLSWALTEKQKQEIETRASSGPANDSLNQVIACYSELKTAKGYSKSCDAQRLTPQSSPQQTTSRVTPGSD